MLKSITSPQLSALSNHLGEDVVIALLTKAINEVCIMNNTSMVAEVQVMIAASILKDYWTLRIEEIFDALANGCKRKYGEINFKGVDYPTIMKWMQHYEEDRSIALENMHLDKKAETTYGQTSRVMQPTPLDGMMEKMEMIRSGLHDANQNLRNKNTEKYYNNGMLDEESLRQDL